MARPQTDIDAGREQLLEVVDDLVRKRGSADISMTDLAAAAGMSPSNLYRFFANREALLEAVAERFFAEKVKIMEEVTAADLPIRDKMFQYFGRRFELMVQQYEAEPDLLKSYLEMGQQHFAVLGGEGDRGDDSRDTRHAGARGAGQRPGRPVEDRGRGRWRAVRRVGTERQAGVGGG